MGKDCPLHDTVSFPCPLSVCVCLCYSCHLHPTTSLPCLLYHSLFLWTDICGKINQSQTSHLSSQINFAPLFNLRRTINFKHTYTHPGFQSERASPWLPFYCYSWKRRELLTHVCLRRSDAVIGKLHPDCLPAGQVDGCEGLCWVCSVLLLVSQITPLWGKWAHARKQVEAGFTLLCEVAKWVQFGTLVCFCDPPCLKWRCTCGKWKKSNLCVQRCNTWSHCHYDKMQKFLDVLKTGFTLMTCKGSCIKKTCLCTHFLRVLPAPAE